MATVVEITSDIKMQEFGERLGRIFAGGEVIELVGDVGAGKTTLVRGIARGMGVDETVQSPSFTINRVYDAGNGRQLVHYDFYRLSDPGIMRNELAETMNDSKTVVVIEWADTVGQTLPQDRLTLTITSTGEDVRRLDMKAGGAVSSKIAGLLT